VLERLAMGLSLALHASSLQEQGVWLARCRERQDIANTLHDDVAPILFSARCALESLLDMPDAASASELLTYARDLVVRGESAVREVMKSSSDCAGVFTFELAELLRALEDRFRIPIAFDVDPSAEAEGVELGDGASRALLRATKEGVSNAVTHAAPSLITVSLEASRGWLRLQVADNGCGRRLSPGGGHGLRSVRKELWRLGGELKLAVDEAAGAILSIRLPVA
jgi:signal transduction histidine kinase